MKNLEWFKDVIETMVPEAQVSEVTRTKLPKTATVYKSKPPGRGQMLDARCGDNYVVVTWTVADGFGISTPDEDEPMGLPPSELYTDGGEALRRVEELLEHGGKARSRRELQLQELRKHRSVSQAVLAGTLGVSQASISQTEQRGDILVSTLAGYIASLGGELRIAAKFPTETIDLEFDDEKKTAR